MNNKSLTLTLLALVVAWMPLVHSRLEKSCDSSNPYSCEPPQVCQPDVGALLEYDCVDCTKKDKPCLDNYDVCCRGYYCRTLEELQFLGLQVGRTCMDCKVKGDKCYNNNDCCSDQNSGMKCIENVCKSQK